MREARLGVLRVERPARETAAGRAAHDHRHGRAGPVVLLGGHGHELVPGDGDEVRELHLGDGPHADERGAGATADDRDLGQRRVDDPPFAELLLETLRHLERSAEGADVLADQEDALVAAHLLAEPVRDRLQVGLDGHVGLPEVRRVELFGLGEDAVEDASSGSGSGLASARSTASSRSALHVGADLVVLVLGEARRSRAASARKRSIGSRFSHSSNISRGT